MKNRSNFKQQKPSIHNRIVTPLTLTNWAPRAKSKWIKISFFCVKNCAVWSTPYPEIIIIVIILWWSKFLFFFCFNCFQNQAKQTRTTIYFHQTKLQARPGCLQSQLGMRQLHPEVQYREITKVVCWIMVCQTTIHVSCFNCLSNYDSLDKRGHSFCMFLQK